MRPFGFAIHYGNSIVKILEPAAQVPDGTEQAMSRLPRNIDDNENDDDVVHETVHEVQTARPKTEQPPLYQVVLINDDYTPMGFVVDVLRVFFHMDVEKATRVMLKVHTEGKGVCGVYSKDIAESKAAQVNNYSREYEHPLLCSVEVDR